MEEITITQDTQETAPTIKKKRIDWIDVAKFFGIVLVFIAHGVWPEPDNLVPGIIRGIIYSFHMPLFFVLSMMTCSLSKSKEDFLTKTKRRAIHLLIPYFIIFVIITIVDIAYLKSDASDPNWWYQNIIRFVGVEQDGNLYMGPVWFLMAQFTGQSIFDLLHLTIKKDSYLFIIVAILSTLGVLMGQTTISYPFTLDMVLSSMFFFFAGYKLKNFDFGKHQIAKFLVCLILWISLLLLTSPVFNEMKYYEVWMRHYPLYPICIICALCGCIAYMYIIKWFCKIKYIYKPFAFLGKFSLILLCVHTIDQFYFNYWFMFYPDNKYLTDFLGALIGLGISLVIMGLICLYRFLKPKIEHKTYPS